MVKQYRDGEQPEAPGIAPYLFVLGVLVALALLVTSTHAETTKLTAPCTAVITGCSVFTTATTAPAVSPIGSRIVVEDFECHTTSERSIECRNIGRVCREKTTAYAAWEKTWFACAVKGTHCPTDAETKAHPNPSECWPIKVGGF